MIFEKCFYPTTPLIWHQMKCDACKRHVESTSPFLDIFVCDGCYHNLISKVFYPHSIDAWSHKKYQIDSVATIQNGQVEITSVPSIIQNIYYVSLNSKIHWCISGERKHQPKIMFAVNSR